ncbi:MAG: hypothetical protein HZA13_09125 [Nitrospirae bacterium]|nr:hypothetical protein [Nitrospirota bacterium]
MIAAGVSLSFRVSTGRLSLCQASTPPARGLAFVIPYFATEALQWHSLPHLDMHNSLELKRCGIEYLGPATPEAAKMKPVEIVY